MASLNDGKREVIEWIKARFPIGQTCLDVGACDGKWFGLLGDHLRMDAVEIFEPNITTHRLRDKYRRVLNCDICDYEYRWYDLVIFGDVLEHLTVADAQMVLAYARKHCRDYIIGVPFEWPQGAIYGNPYEAHIQDDLTPEIFNKRYPDHELIVMPRGDYAYYHRGDGPPFRK